MKRCEVCGEALPFLGLAYHPPVCSLECLVALLKNRALFPHKPPDTLEGVEVYPHTRSFHSAFEEEVWRALRPHVTLEYEPYAIRVNETPRRMYVPDFYVPEAGLFLEIKGRPRNMKGFLKAQEMVDIYMISSKWWKLCRKKKKK